MRQTVLITGGTGLVGQALTKMLIDEGFSVIILTRNPDGKIPGEHKSYARWNTKKRQIDIDVLQQSDFIIHLAGAGVVDKKWTDDYKNEILESRTASSQLIVDTLRNNTHKVQAVVSASAIGWYGEDSTPPVAFTEDTAADPGFLGETCRLWEASIEPVTDLGIRLVKLRTGIVLSNDGGALAEFKKPLRLGVAAILGSGSQMISWIHMNDLCRIYMAALKHEKLTGSYNAVAPHPVSNKELTITLAKALNGRMYIPMRVPEFVLKLMMGKRSIEVLKSATVCAEKIQSAGFAFSYATIDKAIDALAKK